VSDIHGTLEVTHWQALLIFLVLSARTAVRLPVSQVGVSGMHGMLKVISTFGFASLLMHEENLVERSMDATFP
jgi:hypothetical protein